MIQSVTVESLYTGKYLPPFYFCCFCPHRLWEKFQTGQIILFITLEQKRNHVWAYLIQGDIDSGCKGKKTRWGENPPVYSVAYSPSASDCPEAMSGESRSELLAVLVTFTSFFIEILDDILSWYSLNKASTYNKNHKLNPTYHSSYHGNW